MDWSVQRKESEFLTTVHDKRHESRRQWKMLDKRQESALPLNGARGGLRRRGRTARTIELILRKPESVVSWENRSQALVYVTTFVEMNKIHWREREIGRCQFDDLRNFSIDFEGGTLAWFFFSSSSKRVCVCEVEEILTVRRHTIKLSSRARLQETSTSFDTQI